MRGIDRQLGRLLRGSIGLAGATALTWLLVRWGGAAWSDLRALPDTPAATPADAIADVAAVLALGAWSWLLLGAIVTVAEAVLRPSGRQLAPRIAPAAWRRLVISVAGIGLLSAPLGAVQASPGDPAHLVGARLSPDPGSPSTLGPARAIHGLPLPDRPFSRPPSRLSPEPVRDRAMAPTQRVTVRPGDSLWAIAQRQLGPRATDQTVSTEWRRWYAANRARVGPNPDLIHPGMVLHAPTRKATS